MSRCLRVLEVGFMVLGFTLLGVVLVVTARRLELRELQEGEVHTWDFVEDIPQDKESNA